MRATATFDDGVTEIVFSARLVPSDYGVPGSPVWDEVEDVTIDAIAICGRDIPVSAIPAEAINAYLSLADEVDFERENAA